MSVEPEEETAEAKAERYEKTLRAIASCTLTGVDYGDWIQAVCEDALEGLWPECWNCGTAVHDGPCVGDEVQPEKPPLPDLDYSCGAASQIAWLLDDGLLCVGACFGGFKLVTYTDSSAIRFARKVDAEATIVGLKCLGYPHAHRVTAIEHQWLDAALRPT